MGYRARRIDANQNEIVNQFRKLGCLVSITSNIGNGFPDLVVGIEGNAILVEVKDGSKPASARKLTPDEQKFHDLWHDYAYIVSSEKEVNELVERMKNKL